MGLKDSVKSGLFIGTMIVALVMLGNGFLIGYYHGTGELPKLSSETASYLPPEASGEVELTKVSVAIEEDPVDKQDYRIGYNCLDFAWDAMRNLSWQGIPSYVAAVQFEDGTNHAVLAIPTSDTGLTWFDPQNDVQIEPQVGKMYMGKRVAGLRLMYIKWLTLEEFAAMLIEENVNGR